jgi:hypothetical protein
MVRVLRCLVIVCALASAVWAQKPVLVENFDDNKMDPAVWMPFIDGAGPVANERNECLEVVIPGWAYEKEAPHSFGGGFKSAKCLRGDFDLQVEYKLIDWPEGSGVRVGLGLFPVGTGQMGNVNRATYGPPEGGPTDSYAADYQTGGGGVPTSHTSGALRLARVGNRLTAGVYIEGEWVELYASDFSEADYHFAITAWSHDGVFADVPVKIRFDNLIVHYGQLVAPGAPPATTPQIVQSQRVPVPTPPIPAAFQSFRMISMPYGRPFYRAPELPAGSVPSKCGPYSRLRIALPGGRPEAEPQPEGFTRK